ncbi:dihydropteroate synthase [Minwuia sp.]|uniref:dihydropteroate synthase n=1 Tax=Minwuia sp. TaxID=2493630 RepID=UPI003A8D6B41
MQRLLSSERLSSYADIAASSNLNTLQAYEWNTKLSGAFYAPLQGLEIALRNTIDLTMKQAFDRDDWFRELEFQVPQQRALTQARKDLARQIQQQTTSDIVAKLSFGFWVGLLGPGYSAQGLWNRHLHRAFPEARLQRKECHRALDRLRKLRNRIAHHEPILHRDLVTDHDLILEVLGWICPDTRYWVRTQSDFPSCVRDYMQALRGNGATGSTTLHGSDPDLLVSPTVMGIVNVTPDSFSDGGKASEADTAVAQAFRLVREGAGIVDVGAESTRPGAREVPIDEEWARLEPVLAALRGHDIRVSVDTRKAEVMRRALALGVPVINDVSALTFDPDALPVVADSDADVVLMHAQGLPETMQDNPSYDDLIGEVGDYLSDRIAACEAAGIDRARIIVDPGIGFGKTFRQNLQLLRHLAEFQSLGVRILVGASRKGFIGWLTGVKQADQRLGGSIGAALAAVQGGADIIRVHDVAETVQAITVYRAGLRGQADDADR